MFSMLPAHAYTAYQIPYYTPQVSSPLSSSSLRLSSSPLSPRHANLPSRQFPMSSPTPAEKMRLRATSQENNFNVMSNDSGPSVPEGSLFGAFSTKSEGARSQSVNKRGPVKRNPLIHGRESGDDARETRRKLFLKKVQDGREEKRWEARGGDDEIMRTLWVAEQRRHSERQARDARYVPASQEEEMDLGDYESAIFGTAQWSEEAMAEELARQEQEEMEALISMMDMENSQMVQEEAQGRLVSSYGSEDDEYDHLFKSVIDAEIGFDGNDEMMDMS